MNVPLLNLKAQYQSLKPALDAALIRVAESQVCILGDEVEALEKTMAEYCNTRFALGVSSGTDALLMALMALGVGVGDEVIVPTFSFFATAGAVARLGAIPVFIDSEADGFNLNPSILHNAITPRTKAIIPVHLFGQCADMDTILEIAQQHSIPVIEDAAQALGTTYKDGRKAGSMGFIGCFSFYPTKNLGAFGDAGLITTNDEEFYTKLKQMRNHGMEPRYYHKFVGGNFRMDAMQAAVLNVKFPYLEEWHEARRNNANLYTKLFLAEGLAKHVPRHHICQKFPNCPHCATSQGNMFDKENIILLPQTLYEDYGTRNYHIYHQYTIRVPERDRLRKYLAEKGIATEIYYPLPLHRQECFETFSDSNSANSFPVANCLAAHVLALPIYPELSEEQIHYVVQNIAEFYRSLSSTPQ